MKEKNWTLEQQTHKTVRSFVCQQALLSPRDYKVIFALSVIIILWSMILRVPNILNWQLTGWQYAVHFVAFRVTDAIEGWAIIFIPVMLLIRRNVTRALKKNIQKLEQALSVREQINSLSHRL